MKSVVIVRIKGGLGNQLFCYAAARRLALLNNSELIIDDVTGFVRDAQYCRQYMLGHFQIPVRVAIPSERMEPFERYRRVLNKWFSRRKPFSERQYLEQEKIEFDERLLNFKVNGSVYLDGLWQSEDYFKDVEQIIRDDLRIFPPEDNLNQSMAEDIYNNNSVALHVRWFDGPGDDEVHNLSVSYYQRAIELMESKLKTPRYFLFSDNPSAARKKLQLPDDRVSIVDHNRGDKLAYADLWLMSQCRHFITANSTFSWWGAWLGRSEDKIVTAPYILQNKVEKTNWGFKGLIPNQWITL